ncbi:hypothetical protein M3Y94_00580700 [Aphelenchoides besseyi]|nr:hypothetical protein M3Y94_00580700 [Aphelenchoides besseyi]KAI6222023.1 hypothetical protein M3Y95_00940600 [Aphelenchoides besseyi]
MRNAVVLFFCLFISTTVTATSFLDVYIRVFPRDDFCGAKNCNVTYALSVLLAQNQFDLQSVMLQDGSMARNERLYFEDNTVIRLNSDLYNTLGKVYLGLTLFDVPDDMQSAYSILDVTQAINKGHRAKADFITDTVKVRMLVYKRSEAAVITEHGERAEEEAAVEFSRNSGLAEHVRTEKDRHIEPQGCACSHRQCDCCRHLTIRKLRLDDIACVNLTYVPDHLGFKTALSVNGHVYYSKEISVTDTLPMCFELPWLREYASLCLKLYNFELHDKTIGVCTEIEARLYHVKVSRKKIGCLRIPI